MYSGQTSNKSLGTLQLTIVSANLTSNKEHIKQMNPYVQIKYASQLFETSIDKNNSSSPVWQQTFNLPVQSMNDEIELKVFGHSEYKDKQIGSVIIRISELCELNQQKEEFDLKYKSKDVGKITLEALYLGANYNDQGIPRAQEQVASQYQSYQQPATTYKEQQVAYEQPAQYQKPYNYEQSNMQYQPTAASSYEVPLESQATTQKLNPGEENELCYDYLSCPQGSSTRKIVIHTHPSCQYYNQAQTQDVVEKELKEHQAVYQELDEGK